MTCLYFFTFILAWSYDDERHCLDYPSYPELTRFIVSRLDVIEKQRAELHVLDHSQYQVCHSRLCIFIHSRFILGLFGSTWLEVRKCHCFFPSSVQYFQFQDLPHDC